ncbi:hypothetical protein DFH28DRAFT_378759 [Melampsora americana]|nr:hypothetical protein DFH28DRAFT_378759 [Melampsora americana]
MGNLDSQSYSNLMARYATRYILIFTLLTISIFVFLRRSANEPRGTSHKPFTSFNLTHNLHNIKRKPWHSRPHHLVHSQDPSFPRTQAMRIFPRAEGESGWRSNNQNTLARLIECHYQPHSIHCRPKDKHVVLFGSAHFVRVVDGMFNKKVTFPAGEGISSISIFDHWRRES